VAFWAFQQFRKQLKIDKLLNLNCGKIVRLPPPPPTSSCLLSATYLPKPKWTRNFVRDLLCGFGYTSRLLATEPGWRSDLAIMRKLIGISGHMPVFSTMAFYQA
jgi:hypothetical protein